MLVGVVDLLVHYSNPSHRVNEMRTRLAVVELARQLAQEA
jgi:hypothetical protein